MNGQFPNAHTFRRINYLPATSPPSCSTFLTSTSKASEESLTSKGDALDPAIKAARSPSVHTRQFLAGRGVARTGAHPQNVGKRQLTSVCAGLCGAIIES